MSETAQPPVVAASSHLPKQVHAGKVEADVAVYDGVGHLNMTMALAESEVEDQQGATVKVDFVLDLNARHLKAFVKHPDGRSRTVEVEFRPLLEAMAMMGVASLDDGASV